MALMPHRVFYPPGTQSTRKSPLLEIGVSENPPLLLSTGLHWVLLSKGFLCEIWHLFPHRRKEPGSHSSTLLKWLCNPYPTRVLGVAIEKVISYKFNIANL